MDQIRIIVASIALAGPFGLLAAENPVFFDEFNMIGRSNIAGVAPSRTNKRGTLTAEYYDVEKQSLIWDVFSDGGFRPIDGDDPFVCYPAGSSVTADPDDLGAGGAYHGLETTIGFHWRKETGQALRVHKLFKQSSNIHTGGWKPTDGERASHLNGLLENSTNPTNNRSLLEIKTAANAQQKEQGLTLRKSIYCVIHESTAGCDAEEHLAALNAIYEEVSQWANGPEFHFIVVVTSDFAVRSKCCIKGEPQRRGGQEAQLAFLAQKKKGTTGIRMPEDATLYKPDGLHLSSKGYQWLAEAVIEQTVRTKKTAK